MTFRITSSSILAFFIGSIIITAILIILGFDPNDVIDDSLAAVILGCLQIIAGLFIWRHYVLERESDEVSQKKSAINTLIQIREQLLTINDLMPKNENPIYIKTALKFFEVHSNVLLEQIRISNKLKYMEDELEDIHEQTIYVKIFAEKSDYGKFKNPGKSIVEITNKLFEKYAPTEHFAAVFVDHDVPQGAPII